MRGLSSDLPNHHPYSHKRFKAMFLRALLHILPLLQVIEKSDHGHRVFRVRWDRSSAMAVSTLSCALCQQGISRLSSKPTQAEARRLTRKVLVCMYVLSKYSGRKPDKFPGVVFLRTFEQYHLHHWSCCISQTPDKQP